MRFGRCQIWFWSGVRRCETLEWTQKVQSIFSHFVRRDTSHLSKAVSGIFGRYDYRILDNKTVYLTQLAREREAITYHAPHANMVTMVLPPSLVRKHANT